MVLPVGSYSPHVLMEQGSDIPYIVNAAGARVALALAANTNTLFAQTKFVSAGGDDTTGDGSFAKPYLTIQAAMNAITDANSTTKPYAIKVGPGVFATAFTLKPGVYIIGAGSGAGNYNATPLSGATVIAPTAAQALSAGWSGAGFKTGGILACALSTALVFNFAAIGSTAAASVLLDDVNTISAITMTGSGSLEYVTMKNVVQNSTPDITLANMGGGIINGVMNDFGGRLIITQSAAIQSFYTITGCELGNLTGTWTSALQANTMTLNILNRIGQGNPTLTGTGLTVISEIQVAIGAGDANQVIAFGQTATETIKGVSRGRQIVSMTPTVARTISIFAPLAQGETTILLRNNSTTIPIDFTFASGTVPAGSASYVQPLKTVRIVASNAGGVVTWYIDPVVQRGTVTLTNGISALIPCDLVTQSSITFDNRLPGGTLGTGGYMAFNGDRVNGTRASGTAGFKITAIDLTGTLVATDSSQLDWQVN